MKGKYVVKNPQKYIGDSSKVTFRSSWELRMFQWADSSPSVVRWNSEGIAIPYLKPTDKKIHKYYPDIYLEIQRDGKIEKFLIEIKPEKEAVLKKKSSTYDKLAIMINEAKWFSARQFCDKHNIKFEVLTEKQMFHQGKK